MNKKSILRKAANDCFAHTKKERGITLIALVVTIIVLLILAGVTIGLVLGQEGIFSKAQEATEKTEVSSDMELLRLAVLESIMNDGTIDRDYLNSHLPKGFIFGHGSYINTDNKREYKIDDVGKVTEMTEELDSLEKFLLGESKDGVFVATLLESDGSFKDNKYIDSTLLSMKNYGIEDKCGLVFLEYKGKIYQLKSKETNGIPVDIDHMAELTTDSVEFIYEPKGNEGKKVLYSYDGIDANKKWTILYDEGEYYEIISPELLGGGYTIGNSINVENAIEQYNNAIDNLNKECEKLITNQNKISVRSVGSDPQSPNSKNVNKVVSDILKNYNGVLNGEDKNYKSDLVRMSLFNEYNVNEAYWLSSCEVNMRENNKISFLVRILNSEGTYTGEGVFGQEYKNGAYNFWNPQNTHKVRPIVKVKKSEVTVVQE